MRLLCRSMGVSFGIVRKDSGPLIVYKKPNLGKRTTRMRGVVKVDSFRMGRKFRIL